ncbi:MULTISPECIES: nucleotidyl transferase AbiEii/AbiGii toxin family protein [unclassified Saccharicrinis]|uniref:nucleotidyl transferase AbiEii/AbiGii toxin family protein n=1 Tax=unclassified Saccharicrinis TaxID=2646859 RepID=UPI003D3594D4
MTLHTENELFEAAIKETADSLGIKDYFIEKDYWISLVLKRLSESKYVDLVVFKGGTSLSKGHKLINRFSEDVDVAVILTPGTSGNKIKTLIRTVEKEIATDLSEKEIIGVTSKGSRFRKAVYEFPVTLMQKQKSAVPESIIVEINSFANPFPYNKVGIQSMIGEYLQSQNQDELVKKYDLAAFKVNVLDKEQTLIEKLVSLIRFSFDENPIESISGKIRHFYDLYYLLQDETCNKYVNSDEFKAQFRKVLAHDQQQFDEPSGWNKKTIQDSPLIKDFDSIWEKLKLTYTNELSMLAYSEIPNEKDVAQRFKELIKILAEL